MAIVYNGLFGHCNVFLVWEQNKKKKPASWILSQCFLPHESCQRYWSGWVIKKGGMVSDGWLIEMQVCDWLRNHMLPQWRLGRTGNWQMISGASQTIIYTPTLQGQACRIKSHHHNHHQGSKQGSGVHLDMVVKIKIQNAYLCIWA